jgi:hypothetical protein
MTLVRLIPNSLVASAGWDAEGPVTVAKLSTDDGAASAVYSPTADNYMRFLVDASTVPAGSTINSVTVGASTLKLDPVLAQTVSTVTIGSTTYEGTPFSPSTNNVYEYGTSVFTTNPGTSAAWTVGDLSTTAFGLKKVNGAGERASFIYADVDYSSVAPPVAVNLGTGGMMGLI